MKKKDLLFIFAFLSIVGWGPFSFFSSAFLTKDAPIGSKQWLDTETKKNNAKTSNVDHGKNSGEANATSFSNDPSSLKSSIGVFLTSDIYDGKHGRSLRIQGLER